MSSPEPRALIDIGLIGPLLRRVLKMRSFIGLVLLGLAATGAVAYMSRPVFQSEAVLLYQDRGATNPMAAQREATSARRIGLMLQEMLFSHKLLEKLIQEFGLYTKTIARVGMVGAIAEMQKTDLHFNAREGYVFRISFQSDSPELAQQVAARASQLLIQANIDARLQEAKETERFLDSEKARVEEELRGRESELALFMARHPEVLDNNSVRGGVPSPDNSAADTSSLGLEMQALQLRERLTQLRRSTSPSSEPSKPAVSRETAEARSRMEAELAAAQRELTEKQAQFTEEYPDVKRAIIRVESAKARLRHLEESASQAAVVPNHPATTPSAGDPPEARVVQQQLELVEKQIRAVRAQRRPQPKVAPALDPVVFGRDRAQYTELERRARESRENLNLLESRQFQAEVQSVFASQANRADLVLADPAYKPVAPLRSARLKISLIGGLASIVFALFVSLVQALRDDRLRHAADLRRFGLPPLLCEVPPPQED